MARYVIYTDAGWRERDRNATIGISVQDTGWEIIAVARRLPDGVGHSSNNVEMLAAEAAGGIAREHDLRGVQLYTDSMCVERNFTHLAKLFPPGLAVSRVPNEENWRADILARLARTSPMEPNVRCIDDVAIGGFKRHVDFVGARVRQRKLLADGAYLPVVPYHETKVWACGFDVSPRAAAEAQQIIEDQFPWHCVHGGRGFAVLPSGVIRVLCACNDQLDYHGDDVVNAAAG